MLHTLKRMCTGQHFLSPSLWVYCWISQLAVKSAMSRQKDFLSNVCSIYLNQMPLPAGILDTDFYCNLSSVEHLMQRATKIPKQQWIRASSACTHMLNSRESIKKWEMGGVEVEKCSFVLTWGLLFPHPEPVSTEDRWGCRPPAKVASFERGILIHFQF